MKKILPSDAVQHPKHHEIACRPDGSIYSIKTGRTRSLWKTRHGYLQIAVGGTSYLAHRLIADVFVDNPNKKPFINHKNGIKSDNRSINLEWCTQLENVRHARDVLGIKFSVPGFKCSAAKITERDVRIMVELFKFGLSSGDISRIIECSKATVQVHLKKSGVTRYR